MSQGEMRVSQRELHRVHVVRLTLEGRESVGKGAKLNWVWGWTKLSLGSVKIFVSKSSVLGAQHLIFAGKIRPVSFTFFTKHVRLALFDDFAVRRFESEFALHKKFPWSDPESRRFIHFEFGSGCYTATGTKGHRLLKLVTPRPASVCSTVPVMVFD